MAHRPCAHGGPHLRCSASRNGAPEQRRALHHHPGSLPGPRQRAPAFQGASRLRRWGLGSARQPAVPGASPSLLLTPAVDVASPASLSLFLMPAVNVASPASLSLFPTPAVDVASPASPALTWLWHRAGFSEHSRTRVASLGERGCRGAPGEVRSPSGLPGFVSPRWSLCSPLPASVVW